MEKNNTSLPDTGFLQQIEGNDQVDTCIWWLQRSPDRDDVWLTLGTYYHEEKRHELARKCYEAAVAVNPRNANAHFNLGNHYWFRDNDPERVKMHYLLSMEADPEDGDAATSLGRYYAEANDMEKAIEYMLKGYECDPENHYSSMSLGFYFLLYGDPDRALYFADIAIGLGEIEISSLNKGHVLLIRGEEQAAIDCYAASLNAFGTEDAFWVDYASDFEVMPQYGISQDYYDSLRNKISKRAKDI